ncbi:MAG TPA: TfoX/Sxy family protein [Anaerolineales bacterium]|nr:TfoX/Sxy family protein [Anaerolineales bacterium]
MAYNEKLAERIRVELGETPHVENKMFGGIGFLVHGNMACGVHKENMIVRVDPEKHEKLLKRKNIRVFDITGRAMKGWLMVEPDGCKTAKQVSAWVREGVTFALTLPPK